MNAHHATNELAPAAHAETASERRRRKRIKVSAQVRVRATDPKADAFTVIGMSVDISRDGILFSTARRDFWKGMSLGVTFPFSDAPGALNAEQSAEVVRTIELPENKMGVAIQFRHIHTRAAAATAVTGPGSKEKSSVNGASSAAKGAPVQPSSARPIILVVEADPRSQEQLKNLLTPEGYDVFVVSTGQAALDILRTTVPACFIAEVEAGDTSGYDLCLIIKNSERLTNVPVVLVTRNAQPADYAASHNFGAVVCMAKPFKLERMLQVVRLVAPPPSKTDQSAYASSRNDASLLERNV
ncbi:MAG TPA: response regulator [Candidatus Limnocylindrales bacterium]|nr:response regulator [Candidatus Limnocylindrales bacterium]